MGRLAPELIFRHGGGGAVVGMTGGLTFAPRFRVESIDREAVFLLSERGHVVLRGDAYLQLAPLLDGRRDVTALVDALDGVVPAAEVYFAVVGCSNRDTSSTRMRLAIGPDGGTTSASTPARPSGDSRKRPWRWWGLVAWGVADGVVGVEAVVAGLSAAGVAVVDEGWPG